MIDRPLPYDLTPEDRRVRAKWARGVAIVYGAALLVLVAAIAVQRLVAPPTTEVETTVATVPVNAPSPIGPN
jgi:hypothetical protein